MFFCCLALGSNKGGNVHFQFGVSGLKRGYRFLQGEHFGGESSLLGVAHGSIFTGETVSTTLEFQFTFLEGSKRRGLLVASFNELTYLSSVSIAEGG